MELPDTALTDALIASYEDHNGYHLNTIWYHLYQMKSLIGSTIEIKESLSAILAVKMDQPESFSKYYYFKPSQKLLKEAKKAATKYNDSHSSCSY